MGKILTKNNLIIVKTLNSRGCCNLYITNQPYEESDDSSNALYCEVYQLHLYKNDKYEKKLERIDECFISKKYISKCIKINKDDYIYNIIKGNNIKEDIMFGYMFLNKDLDINKLSSYKIERLKINADKNAILNLEEIILNQ